MSSTDRPGSPLPGAPSAPSATGREEGTTFIVRPQFTSTSLMPETQGKLLEALKAQLGQLTIESSSSGFRHEDGRYQVLPRTLRSAWMAKVNHPVVGEIKFLVGQTRSTWVLVYDVPPEKIYEDPRFMNMDLKLRDVTRTPKGKRMYVSRIERSDLDLVNGIAAQDAGGRGHPDSLAPVEGSFSYEATLTRLGRCTLVSSTDPMFDLVGFVATIHFMTPTQGDRGDYYYLDAGDPEAPMTCVLHVGHDPRLPAETYSHKVELAYRDERAFLYVDFRYV